MKEQYMTYKEADRLHILLEVKEKRISLKRASTLIRLSYRQTKRIWRLFRIDGKKGILSKKRGRPNPNKIPKTTKDIICNVLQTKYYGFGPTFAAEKLKENEKISISKESLRQIMITENLWIPKKKKLLKIYQRRTRRSSFGELIQIDGSYEYWFEDRAEKCCLLVFIDDATSKIVEMRFCKHETTQDYLISLKRYVKRYGKPCTLYSDKHNIFRVNKKEYLKGENITQFGRVLKDLDIDLICAHSPQAKGRVERANGILQDRLIKEMRLKNISSMEEGNLYLEEYMKKHNNRFGKEPLKKENKHKPIKLLENLDKIMAIQEKRKLSKVLSFQYGGVIYQIRTSKPTHAMQHAGITVIDYGSGDIEVDYRGQRLEYSKWNEMPTQGRIIDSKALHWANKKINKPKKYHPWR